MARTMRTTPSLNESLSAILSAKHTRDVIKVLIEHPPIRQDISSCLNTTPLQSTTADESEHTEDKRHLLHATFLPPQQFLSQIKHSYKQFRHGSSLSTLKTPKGAKQLWKLSQYYQALASSNENNGYVERKGEAGNDNTTHETTAVLYAAAAVRQAIRYNNMQALEFYQALEYINNKVSRTDENSALNNLLNRITTDLLNEALPIMGRWHPFNIIGCHYITKVPALLKDDQLIPCIFSEGRTDPYALIQDLQKRDELIKLGAPHVPIAVHDTHYRPNYELYSNKTDIPITEAHIEKWLSKRDNDKTKINNIYQLLHWNCESVSYQQLIKVFIKICSTHSEYSDETKAHAALVRCIDLIKKVNPGQLSTLFESLLELTPYDRYGITDIYDFAMNQLLDVHTPTLTNSNVTKLVDHFGNNYRLLNRIEDPHNILRLKRLQWLCAHGNRATTDHITEIKRLAQCDDPTSNTVHINTFVNQVIASEETPCKIASALIAKNLDITTDIQYENAYYPGPYTLLGRMLGSRDVPAASIKTLIDKGAKDHHGLTQTARTRFTHLLKQRSIPIKYLNRVYDDFIIRRDLLKSCPVTLENVQRYQAICQVPTALTTERNAKYGMLEILQDKMRNPDCPDAIIHALLSTNVDIDNVTDADFIREPVSTTLLWQAITDRPSLVETLLERGANVTSKHIHHAIRNNPEVLSLLLDHGGNPNAINNSCNPTKTALSLAIEGKHWDICKLLISKGAKIQNRTDAKNYLKYQAEKPEHHLDPFKRIADPDYHLYTEALSMASDNNNHAMVIGLTNPTESLQPKHIVRITKQLLNEIARQPMNAHTVSLLLKPIPNVASLKMNGQSLMHHAITTSKWPLVNCLIASNVLPSTDIEHHLLHTNRHCIRTHLLQNIYRSPSYEVWKGKQLTNANKLLVVINELIKTIHKMPAHDTHFGLIKTDSKYNQDKRDLLSVLLPLFDSINQAYHLLHYRNHYQLDLNKWTQLLTTYIQTFNRAISGSTGRHAIQLKQFCENTLHIDNLEPELESKGSTIDIERIQPAAAKMSEALIPVAPVIPKSHIDHIPIAASVHSTPETMFAPATRRPRCEVPIGQAITFTDDTHTNAPPTAASAPPPVTPDRKCG